MNKMDSIFKQQSWCSSATFLLREAR